MTNILLAVLCLNTLVAVRFLYLIWQAADWIEQGMRDDRRDRLAARGTI